MSTTVKEFQASPGLVVSVPGAICVTCHLDTTVLSMHQPASGHMWDATKSSPYTGQTN